MAGGQKTGRTSDRKAKFKYMTDREQRLAAKEFSISWSSRRGDEKAECYPFWSQLLRMVYGVEDVESYARFEVSLDNKTGKSHKFVDVLLPHTHVLIEQKSRGCSLDRAYLRSGEYVTPFEQASAYNELLGYNERARWIITCNFDEFHIHDMSLNASQRSVPVAIIKLNELEYEYERLEILIDKTVEELPAKPVAVSAKAADLISQLYNTVRLQYNCPDDNRVLQHLNKLCVRLVFCFYAEDAGLFNKNQFLNYLEANAKTPAMMRRSILDLFNILDTPEVDRDPYADPLLAAFPYVNGNLFANSTDTEIPYFNEEIMSALLNASRQLDWSSISPTIFGAMFESTMNPETRRLGGMHYTSTENIHKVIDPLFLNDLRLELLEILKIKTTSTRLSELSRFHEKLPLLRFLDPACGSGNFLTETYISLRRLENDVIRARYGHCNRELALDLIKVHINQFYGIEINDFAVAVAKTAMWIAESQMLDETCRIVYGLAMNNLPLKEYNNIIQANALRFDWNELVEASELSYIIGNPPFLGKQEQSALHKEDMRMVFEGVSKSGNLDYVCAWFKKSLDYIQDTPCRCALVATNSITQGEQVEGLWNYMLKNNAFVFFAYRTFKWANEVRDTAAVHCVIIGFSAAPVNLTRYIYTESDKIMVNNINPYLIDCENVIIGSRTSPLCDAPEMYDGSFHLKGGAYELETEYDKNRLVAENPLAEKWIKLYIGGEEYLNNIRRWVLVLHDANPSELRKCPNVMARIEKVRDSRRVSTRPATIKLAENPTRFAQWTHPNCDYLFIPRVNSQRRDYIPMGFVSSDVVASNQALLIPGRNLYVMGILSSSVHMCWVKIVAGRMKSDYRYSKGVVYNTFPWPDSTVKQKEEVAKLVDAVISLRSSYVAAKLSDLYDPLSMPPDLRKAHQRLDKAVLRLYGLKSNASEMQITSMLFALYLQRVSRIKLKT